MSILNIGSIGSNDTLAPETTDVGWWPMDPKIFSVKRPCGLHWLGSCQDFDPAFQGPTKQSGLQARCVGPLAPDIADQCNQSLQTKSIVLCLVFTVLIFDLQQLASKSI